MNIIKELENEKGFYQGILEKVDRNIENGSEGKICCKNHNGCYQYYYKGRYINREERNQVIELVSEEYNERVIPEIKKRIKCLDNLINNLSKDGIRKAYDGMYIGKRRLITPYIPSKEEYISDWLSVKYEGLPFGEDDNSSYYTAKGERVRSKTEILIADTLMRYRIPYRYEYPLKLMDGNRIVTFHPDFTVLNKNTLKVCIMEHYGMMGNADYYNSCMSKLGIYEKNGYLLGKNFIFLHETSNASIDTKVMCEYIEEYLL